MEEAAGGGVTVRLVFQGGRAPKATPRENPAEPAEIRQSVR